MMVVVAQWFIMISLLYYVWCANFSKLQTSLSRNNWLKKTRNKKRWGAGCKHFLKH